MLSTLVLSAALAFTGAPHHQPSQHERVQWTRTHFDACPNEDSRNCVWDGGTAPRGSHRGSFIDVNGRALYFSDGPTFRMLARHVPDSTHRTRATTERDGRVSFVSARVGHITYFATIYPHRVVIEHYR